ncbi:transposase [Arthrobacter sp. BL-252-APC-1A]|uniref:transposase n=1 Tax=Arthrobacter sp. BL-252-APC-1A TaxID=2606622 RepID=UPI0012B39FA1|nr:transposase [Arthrobacter sp. BL-252-APC-1A]MSS00435.1 transposase [Arthrobacter sp. BL-252-APC-1A]
MNPAKDPAAPGPAETVTRLYSLLPGSFTAARNQEAAAAKSSGDAELGKRLKALPKPSAAAWLANMLVREESEAISSVLSLGASLREAQADLDRGELRRLNSERHRMLRALAASARELAEKLGNPVSAAVAAEVEQTLWAAMTDPEAAAALASGRLVRGLEANGWEPVDLDGAVADPDTASPLVASGAASGSARGSASRGAGKEPAKEPSRRQEAARAKALRAAEEELADAREAAGEAERRLAGVQSEVEEQVTLRDGLTDEIDDFRERIRELEREVSAVDRRRGALERSRDTARREARSARRAVEKAEAKLDGLR